MLSTDWQDDAACASAAFGEVWTDPTASGRWESREHSMAKQICQACPVRIQCLQYALHYEQGVGKRMRYGIWGGLSPEERWRLATRHRILTSPRSS